MEMKSEIYNTTKNILNNKTIKRHQIQNFIC